MENPIGQIWSLSKLYVNNLTYAISLLFTKLKFFALSRLTCDLFSLEETSVLHMV